MKTYKAGVLGATGAVGQRFLQLLEDHSMFQVTTLYASERSAGKRYREAANWVQEAPMPRSVREMEVVTGTKDLDCDVLFSAIPSGEAGPLEREFASLGYKVFSNARDNRMADDVPLVITEVNPEHTQLVETQESRRREGGFVLCNANCSAIVMTLSLKPLADAFGLKRVHAVTMQALSGAGYPGVPSLDSTDNVVPYIGGEEAKMESEPRKMLGALNGKAVRPHPVSISATCTRVPVIEAHSMALSVELERKATVAQAAKAFAEFRGKPQELGLPTAPVRPVHVFEEPNRPQPRKERYLEGGMAVAVGRIREDPHYTLKYFALGSNTIRGAAGQSLENAEYCATLGLLD